MKWLVDEDFEGERFDRALATYMDELSRSSLQHKIKEGRILLNGKTAKASQLLQAGDMISFDLDIFRIPPIQAEKLKLDVLYEDKNFLAINKAAGMIVHPTEKIRSGTLVNALLGMGIPLSDRNGEERPGIVHRLDADTTGILLVAKNNATHDYLADLFRNRQVQKLYLAVVEGKFDVHGLEIRAPLGRDPGGSGRMAVRPDGKEAISYVDCLALGKESSLLAVRIVTGRTHQIRVHLKEEGHPVVGDLLYGYRHQRLQLEHQLLHAYRISFPLSPTDSKKMTLTAPPDPVFFDGLRCLGYPAEIIEKLKKGVLC